MGDNAEGGAAIMSVDLANASTFDAFYRTHARDVLRWVIRLGGALLDAEDTTHDVFSVAFRKAHTFTGGSESAWLYGITRRVVANARRRARIRYAIGLHTLPPLPSPGPATDARVERLAQRRLVQAALDTLSDKHREALVLVDLEELTAVEAAQRIGVSVNTLYSRLHYGRKAFAKALEPARAELQSSALRSSLHEGS